MELLRTAQSLALVCLLLGSWTLLFVPLVTSYSTFSQLNFVHKLASTKWSSTKLYATDGVKGAFIEAEGSGSPCRIKVIGVGGGGGNAVNRMLESSTGVLGVELWTVNTDAQALSRSMAPNKLNIGHVTSRYDGTICLQQSILY